jgi:hypothetical protein
MIHLYENLFLDSIENYNPQWKTFFAVEKTQRHPDADVNSTFQSLEIENFQSLLLNQYSGNLHLFWDEASKTSGGKTVIYTDKYYLPFLFFSCWSDFFKVNNLNQFIDPLIKECQLRGISYDEEYVSKVLTEININNNYEIQLNLSKVPLEILLLKEPQSDILEGTLINYVWEKWFDKIFTLKDEIFIFLSDFYQFHFNKEIHIEDNLKHILFHNHDLNWITDDELFSRSKKHVLMNYQAEYFLKINNLVKQFEKSDKTLPPADDSFSMMTLALFEKETSMIDLVLNSKLPVLEYINGIASGNSCLISFVFSIIQNARAYRSHTYTHTPFHT